MGVSIADEDVQHNGSQQRLDVGSGRYGLDDPGDTRQRWPAILLILLVWRDSGRLAEVFLMEALDRAVPRCFARRMQNASFSTVSGSVAISGLRMWVEGVLSTGRPHLPSGIRVSSSFS